MQTAVLKQNCFVDWQKPSTIYKFKKSIVSLVTMSYFFSSVKQIL